MCFPGTFFLQISSFIHVSHNEVHPSTIEYDVIQKDVFVWKSFNKNKTPSKMDVAPWDKHWIKREFDGFGLYAMVFVEIQWYLMVL